MALLVNSLGATPPMELAVITNDALKWCKANALAVDRVYCGATQQACRRESFTVGVSGGRSLTSPVSRRPPISLDTMVARTHRYTHAANVWGLSIIEAPLRPLIEPLIESYR